MANTGVYDGNAHGATGSATGVKSENLSSLSIWEPVLRRASGAAHWVFAGTSRLSGGQRHGAVVISQAPLTVVAANASRYTARPTRASPARSPASRTTTDHREPTAPVPTATSDVGSYPSRQRFLMAAAASWPTYTITSTNGTLTVGKAPVTVTVANAYEGLRPGRFGCP